MTDPTDPVVPQLTDGVVLLRGHRGSDIPRVVGQVLDPGSQRWVDLPMPYDGSHAETFIAEASDRWATGAARSWTIEVDGRFAGTIGYPRRTGQRGELGYGLHPDIRGRGVATRAARLVLDWAFAHDGIEVMAWRAATGNLASWRVAWAHGFSMDGTWRGQHVSSTGRRDDCWVGSLLADEPRTPRRPWWEPALLEGERVRLRPWRPEDTPGGRPDVAAELYNEGMQPTPEGFARWRASRLTRMAIGQGVFWCIADAATDEPLGGIQVQHLDRDFTRGTGMIGYWLHPHARGHGVIQDALDLLVPHAFAARTDPAGRTGLGLHRLQAGTDEGNRASQRALRRSGFREVAQERAVLAHADRPPTGALTYELLDTDDRVAQTIEPAHLPVLETARLRLRPWRAEDAPRPEQGLDQASLRYMPPGAQPTTATFDAWFERRARQVDGGDRHWCIADRATDAPIGCISLFHLGHGTPGDAEVGYWLYADLRGRGYLTEAFGPVLQHAFAASADGGLGLHRLHAFTDAENAASQRVLRRQGFRCWGQDHQSMVRSDGTRSGGAFFELLATSRQHRA